jgi:hypothetical protein
MTFFSVKLRVLSVSVVKNSGSDISDVSVPKCPKCLSGGITILLLFLSLSSFSQQTFDYAPGRVKHRLSLGPVISFYKNHPNHTADTKRKFGFNAAYKAEIFFLRRTNFITGLEFMTQGIKFRGYYYKPGYTYLYDDTFPYTHEIRFNEVQLPISLKVTLGSEKERNVSAYYFGGIGCRYIFGSYVVITNDSTGLSPYDGKETIDFEHQMVTKGFNMFYHGGFGVQKNYRETGRALFFELTFKYGLARIHYSGHEDSNDLSIKNNTLAITFGLRI